MLSVLSSAGRAFLRAFLASLIVFAFGILAAPNLNNMYLLGVAALVSAIVAGLRAVQAYAPEVSLAKYLGHPYGDWADAAIQAFIASLVVTLPGILNAPDLSAARSLGLAVILGAFSAALRAVQGALTIGERPGPTVGLAEPEMPYSYQYPAGRKSAP